jgi:hypothetical protein
MPLAYPSNMQTSSIPTPLNCEKEHLNSDGKQFHQYLQNNHFSTHSTQKRPRQRKVSTCFFFLLISNTHLSYSVAELFTFAQNLIHAVKCIYFAYIHILLH